MSRYLSSALSALRPNVAWTLPGDELLANVVWPAGVVPPTQAEVDAAILFATNEDAATRARSALTTAIQAYVDAPAKNWGYDSAASAVGYVGDPYPTFNAEGAAILAFRSACWAVARDVEKAVRSGARTMPTLEAMLAMLPAAPARPTA